MYFWKCWRDTRVYFFVFVIAGSLVMPLAVAILGGGAADNLGLVAVAEMVLLIDIMTAYGIGALVASEEFPDDSIHFLFAKPRSRSYFVWVGWAAGCLQLLSVITLHLVAAWISLMWFSNVPVKASLLPLATSSRIVEGLVVCLVYYCLTYALTVLTRSGLKGLGSSLLLTIGIEALAVTARMRWHFHLPTPAGAIGSLSPHLSELIWILLALTLIVGAQLRVERVEV